MKSAGRSALMAGAILGLVFSLATPVAQKDEGAAAVAQEDEAAALAARAAALQQAGKYSEAILLAQQILAIREKQLGPDHVPSRWPSWAVFIYNEVATPTPSRS